MRSRSHPPGCVFCRMAEEQIVAKNQLPYGVRDTSPVTSLHTLILARRHVASYFDLEAQEKRAIDERRGSRPRTEISGQASRPVSQKKTGSDAVWSATEATTTPAMERSYRKPRSALPANQATP